MVVVITRMATVKSERYIVFYSILVFQNDFSPGVKEFHPAVSTKDIYKGDNDYDNDDYVLDPSVEDDT